MSLDIRYYNPYKKRYSISDGADDANEATDGTMYLDRNEVLLGNGSGDGIDSQYAFFRYEIPAEDAVNLEDKKALPDTSLVLPFTEYWDFPWSGRLYCELTPSSVPLDGSTSGISTRTRTTAYCDIDHLDFEPVLEDNHSLNTEKIHGYWPMSEESGTRYNAERFVTSGTTHLLEMTSSVPHSPGIDHHAASGLGDLGLTTSGFPFEVPAHNSAITMYFRLDGIDNLNQWTRLLTVDHGLGWESFNVEFAPSGTTLDDAELLFRMNGNGTYESNTLQYDFVSGDWLSLVANTYGTDYDNGLYQSGYSNFFVYRVNGDFGFTQCNGEKRLTNGMDYVETIAVGGDTLETVHNPFSASDLLLASGVSPSALSSLYLHRLNNPKYPLINYGFDEYDTTYASKSSFSYKPFVPVQEVLDTYGSGLSTISFIYEHLEGSGGSPIMSTESGVVEAPDITIDFDLAVAEKTGEMIPDVPENSGLLAYWDMYSEYDRINCVPLFSTSHTRPVVQPLGGVFKSGAVGSLSTQKTVFNANDRADFIHSSSFHAQGDQSYVFWRNKISDNYTALDGFTKYHSDDITGGYSTTSIAYIDSYYTVYSGNPKVLQGQSVRSNDWIEDSRQTMEAISYKGGASPKIYVSRNGQPQVEHNASTMTDASGTFRIGQSFQTIYSEVRIYDRALGDREIQNIYNGAFPSQINKPSPKVQYMYPAEDRMGGGTQRLIHDTDLYFEHLEQTNDQNFQQPEGWSESWADASGKFFSAVNQWHSAYTPEAYGLNLYYIDKVAICPYGINTLKFGVGAMGVKPSAIIVHFEGAGYYSQGTMHTIHESGYTPGSEMSITDVRLYDKNKDQITVDSNGDVIIKHSGHYGNSSDNFIKYNSGLEVVSNVEDYDLSDIQLEFGVSDNNGNPVFGMLHGVSVEVQGEVNIANTGLDLYTNAVLVANSGIDLYTVARDSLNSGMDLYTEGMIVQTSSIPMYTISADFENSGIDLYTYGRDSTNSGMPLITHASDTIFTFRPTMYVSGIGRPTDDLDLSIWGRDSENSGMDLNIWGHIAENSGMDLWIEGVEIDSEGVPFFAEATVSYGSGGFPLYMNSTTNTSLYKARPMYIEVNAEEMGTGGMPLFLNSVTAGSGDQYMPFFLDAAADSMNKGTEMYLKNAFESGFKSQFLYVKGLGTLDGGAIDNGSMPLFIERIEGSEKGMSMYLGVNSGETQGTNMYTYGGTWSTSGIDLTIPSTLGVDNSGMDIYINGF